MIISQSTSLDKQYEENIVLQQGCLLDLNGYIIGNIHITDNSQLSLYGTVNGNITVEPECSLFIYGTLNGNIVNLGYSELHGVLITTGSLPENLIIKENSIINRG